MYYLHLYINCESTEIYAYFDIYKTKLLQAYGDNLHIYITFNIHAS